MQKGEEKRNLNTVVMLYILCKLYDNVPSDKLTNFVMSSVDITVLYFQNPVQ